MKTFLIILLFLFAGCAADVNERFTNIKYGDEFIVNHSFYGRGECTVVEKKTYVKFWGDRKYYLAGECTFPKIKFKDWYHFNEVILKKEIK